MNKDSQFSRNNVKWLLEQPLKTMVHMLNHQISVIQLIVNQILEEDVSVLTGEKYVRDGSSFDRYGYNPGSVFSGKNKVRISVPRVRDKVSGQFKTLESYKAMRENTPDSQEVMEAVLKGLSVRDYASIADYLGESFGLSKSTISKRFIEATKEKLEEFENRSLADDNFIAIYIDGKYLYGAQMMIALGITEAGEKKQLGILQTSSENSQAIVQFLENLKRRGLHYEQGILFIIDGSKGIKKGITDAFGNKAVIQRCTLHKRENILAPLSEKDKEWVKKEYHAALQLKTYTEAKAALVMLASKLEKINRQSYNSILEGLEELLTLHKIEANEEFTTSFNTTNCFESVNSQIQKYVGKVKHWNSSEQRYRWVASALIMIEEKTRKVHNYKKLDKLKEKITTFVVRTP